MPTECVTSGFKVGFKLWLRLKEKIRVRVRETPQQENGLGYSEFQNRF